MTWSAERGFAPAQYTLGTMYRIGWTPASALVSVPVTVLHEPISNKAKQQKQRSRYEPLYVVSISRMRQ